MDLKPIFPHLTDRRAAMVINAVVDLEAAVAAGMVPNKLYVDAKDTLNRAVEEAAEAFLKAGPHEAKHHQSDWWLGAYAGDAFVRGCHGLPTVLKRAKNAGLKEYSEFVAVLIPLNDLLSFAKPLIKKRGELPKVKTTKQIADEALRMTCQCCARRIHANTGTIAHHGYERPGHGWQTGSCGGAKQLPFEVSRDRLGIMIAAWRERRANMKKHHKQTAAEKVAIDLEISDRSKPRNPRTGYYPTLRLDITRENFDALKTAQSDGLSSYRDFDALKEADLRSLSSRIKEIEAAIREQQARYDGWKQTHIRADDKWVRT